MIEIGAYQIGFFPLPPHIFDRKKESAETRPWSWDYCIDCASLSRWLTAHTPGQDIFHRFSSHHVRCSFHTITQKSLFYFMNNPLPVSPSVVTISWYMATIFSFSRYYQMYRTILRFLSLVPTLPPSNTSRSSLYRSRSPAIRILLSIAPPRGQFWASTFFSARFSHDRARRSHTTIILTFIPSES